MGDLVFVTFVKANFDAKFSSSENCSWSAKGLAGSFRECCFAFVARDGNQSAHVLARDSSLDSMDRFWIEKVPPTVVAAVAFDRRNGYPP
ncbi:hypothetical protein GQ457_16G012880 [Hibiscus cannabinus]